MVKTSFYSMVRNNGKNVAVLKTGYSDGTYYYYKSDVGRHWWAIHPLCGQCVTSGKTLKEAATAAHAPAISDKVHQAMKLQGEAMTKLYHAAIAELKDNN